MIVRSRVQQRSVNGVWRKRTREHPSQIVSLAGVASPLGGTSAGAPVLHYVPLVSSPDPGSTPTTFFSTEADVASWLRASASAPNHTYSNEKVANIGRQNGDRRSGAQMPEPPSSGGSKEPCGKEEGGSPGEDEGASWNHRRHRGRNWERPDQGDRLGRSQGREVANEAQHPQQSIGCAFVP
jgi:hypothetical protein